VTLGGLLASVTLSGDQMILTIPDAHSGEIDTGTLTAASSAQFNSAVSALNNTIAADNTAAYRSYQAQQQTQADTGAENQASSDMAALANADSFTSDLAALAKDVSQAQSDLGAVEQAVNAGQGSYYDGVYNANDAVYTVNDDSYSLNDDLDTLTGDIVIARKDIQTLQGDLSSLQSSGLPAPQGASSTISAVQSAISSAVSQANSDIDAVNGYVTSAYNAANGMATGSCSGSGHRKHTLADQPHLMMDRRIPPSGKARRLTAPPGHQPPAPAATGSPTSATQQPLHSPRTIFPGMLSDRPAVYPRRQPRQQAPHECCHPPPRLDPGKPRARPQHQLVKLLPPAIQVYAEPSGQRTIFCCPHNSGSLGGGRLTSITATPQDHEVSLEY
jgi:hypothetical protein